GGEGGEHRDRGRDDVGQVDRVRREEALLADELDEVGDRLEAPVRAGAVRPVAELHPPEQLALEERRVREGEHDEVDDHEGLDEADPPRLAHERVTSTVVCSPSACSSATRTTPATRRPSIRARRRRAVPFERTNTSSPVRTLRRLASSAESSTSGLGRWNWSSGTRSTAGPEKSGR